MDEHRASLDAIQAEASAQGLGASSANQPCDAEDFAFSQNQVNGAGLGLAGQRAQFQNGLADLMRCAGINLADLAPHHQPNNLAQVRAGHLTGAHALAIAQDGVTVANALTLLQKMADIDNADAALAQAANDSEEVLGVHLREAAGWLIHDQHFRLANQCAGDLDDLLLGNRAGAHGVGQRNLLVAQLGESSARQAAAAGAPEPAKRGGLFA